MNDQATDNVCDLEAELDEKIQNWVRHHLDQTEYETRQVSISYGLSQKINKDTTFKIKLLDAAQYSLSETTSDSDPTRIEVKCYNTDGKCFGSFEVYALIGIDLRQFLLELFAM